MFCAFELYGVKKEAMIMKNYEVVERIIDEALAKMKGHIGLYFKYLGEDCGNNSAGTCGRPYVEICRNVRNEIYPGGVESFENDEFYHPASTIKLPMVMAVYKMAAEGKADLEEKVLVTKDMHVPSCGALKTFDLDMEVAVKTLCNLAIVISDNTASNVLIRHFGIETLNEQFKEMGLQKTHIERCFYDDEMQEKGYNNVAVPSEMGALLEQVYKGSFVNADVSRAIWEIIEAQQLRDKVPAYIEDFVPVGNKTGGARGITCDVALIKGDKPFALVVLANETEIPVADDVIRHLGRDIFAAL